MSQALWCDTGNHPFSNIEKGYMVMTITTEEHGTTTAHACAEHKVTLVPVVNTAPALDQAPPTRKKR